MADLIHSDGSFRTFVEDVVSEALYGRLGLADRPPVDQYLVDLLMRFMHRNGIYSVTDEFGFRVESVAKMLEEGDVRLKANSFERERQVHRHIGDFLLFWSGMFPEHKFGGVDRFVNPVIQGQTSYLIVSSFDHPPFDEEAALFRRLGAEFEAMQAGLIIARESMPGLTA
jgi:hypothetical protein